MDDGELDSFTQEVVPIWNVGDLPGCSPDGIFRDANTHACTHTHTCNPPGPNSPHTHTCFHVHTKIVPASTDDHTPGPSEKKLKKCSAGNREAVHNYRENKKASAASLAGELARVTTLNQHLLQRLKRQAALEAENARLKCLLVHIRGSIEGVSGSFPYQNPAESANMYQNLANPNLPGPYMMNQCNTERADQVHCLQPGAEGKSGEDMLLNGQGFNSCEFENPPCLGNQNDGLKEFSNCGIGNITSAVNPSHPN